MHKSRRLVAPMHLSSAGCNIILIEAVRGLDVLDTLCRMGADAICLRLLFAACTVVEVLFVGVVFFIWSVSGYAADAW